MTAAGAARLSARNLSQVQDSIRVPQFAREDLTTRIVHIGVGAFHRCHQADFLQDVVEAGHPVGMAGINLAPPGIVPVLGPQDGLYSRTLADGDACETRVIGVITEVADHAAAPARCLALLADPAVTTVTMTVTEKGYCHIPATGELDPGHAGIRHDLDTRLAAPATLPGFLVAALAARRAAGAGAINLISCDNIAGNGVVLRNVVLAMAGAAGGDLARWIEDHAAFPSTMVDRIVPATRAADRARIEAALGLADAGAVMGEKFRQWVIEDSFRAPRPPWEAAGVEIVADVTPHEHVKMRVLNAAQTTLSLLGALAGHEYSADAVRDPALAGFTGAMIARETLPHLPQVPGMEGAAYLARSLERIRNAALGHRCQQIATDTSQKIRQRLLDPLRLTRAAGEAAPGLETAIAAWIAWLAAGQPAFGGRWEVADPVAGAAAALARDTRGDLGAFARGTLALEPIFGADLAQDAALADRVAGRVSALMDGAPPMAVAGYAA
ncbi:MAG: mannitol dehydrogenase family protein [Rubellimicrobium sp.]|nr:mannitol dehydrogenase family protein [Rubellimicrobium sp.]